jgi:signal transduction histidine kinase
VTPPTALKVFGTVARVLNRSSTLREALDGALRHIVHLLDAQAGWVFLRVEHSDAFALAADVQLPAVLRTNSEHMAGDCRCLTMLRDGTLTEAVNVVPCLRLEHTAPFHGPHHHATVPLATPDETVGLLNLLLAPGRALAAAELEMLEAIGHEMAIAVQRARLFEKVRDREQMVRTLLQRLLAAQEEERRRIASDLHDHAGQMTSALILRLTELAGRPDAKPLAPALHELREMAQRELDQLRKLAYELRPAILDDQGLAPALRWYVQQHVRPAGVEVALTVRGLTTRLPREIEIVAFRIAREAVTNALRHAAPRRLEIRVDRRRRSVLVMVRDDGRGFDPETTGSQGLGLQSMHERAELVGGTVQVVSVPDAGTTVVARLPVPADPP